MIFNNMYLEISSKETANFEDCEADSTLTINNNNNNKTVIPHDTFMPKISKKSLP